MEAMILAAGKGTRLRPITNDKPKALVEINGITLLERVIRELISSGVTRIIINVHHFAARIIDFLNQKNFEGAEIVISDESEKLLNTGGALKKAAPLFKKSNPFILHNVDILTDLNFNEMFNFHISSNAIATLAVQNRKSSRYLLFDENETLCGWMNKKTGELKIARQYKKNPEPFAFSGIHIINPVIFKLMPSADVFSLIDFYLSLAKDHIIKPYKNDKTYWFDVGDKNKLKQAESYLR